MRFGPFVLAIWASLALFVGSGLLAGALAGCHVGPSPDSYGPTAAAVAAANTAPGAVGFVGISPAAPAAVAGAVKSASWLNGLGALALLAGCVILGHPQLPNAFGFGLALGGVALLCAGVLLPLYAGWVGAGLLVLLAAVALGRLKSEQIGSASGAVSRIVSPFLNLFKVSTP